jgi:hypothetical protein
MNITKEIPFSEILKQSKLVNQTILPHQKYVAGIAPFLRGPYSSMYV